MKFVSLLLLSTASAIQLRARGDNFTKGEATRLADLFDKDGDGTIKPENLQAVHESI